MEPVEIIVAALAAGAAAGLGGAAEQAVKDAYIGLKTFIQRKYSNVDVNFLESNPGSKNRQAVLKEDLARTNAVEDAELLQQAQALLIIVQARVPETFAEVNLKANIVNVVGTFRIKDIRKGGRVITDIGDLTVGEDLEISGVSAVEEIPPNA